MRIGILMAGGYGLHPSTDGRKVQIQKQADALEQIGHEVIRLNPWESYPMQDLDAVHLVEGGFGNIPGAYGPIDNVRKMGLATFLDSEHSSWYFRVITAVGSLHPRLMTYQGAVRRQARVCEVVIVRSKEERRLVVEGIGVPSEKVKIVLNGVNPPGRVDPEGVRAELGIEGDFAFHVSTYTQARKNVLRLIGAAGRAGHPLVIAGTVGAGDEAREIKEAAGRYSNIRLLGHLTEFQRDSLYAACRVFCLPSRYEGTGLVALEAASHGANVMITQVGGTPDYFRDLVDYVNPLDAQSIQTALEKAWQRPRDGKLRDYVLNQLSWQASARAMAAAYGF